MAKEKVEEAARGFVKYGDDMAAQFTGDWVDGPMKLGPDVLLYWRLCGWEQKSIDRLAMTDGTLHNELEDYETRPGVIFLGNPEDIREEMHNSIDKMFAHIYGLRSMLGEDVIKKIKEGEMTLDEAIYPETEQGEVEDEE